MVQGVCSPWSLWSDRGLTALSDTTKAQKKISLENGHLGRSGVYPAPRPAYHQAHVLPLNASLASNNPCWRPFSVQSFFSLYRSVSVFKLARILSWISRFFLPEVAHLALYGVELFIGHVIVFQRSAHESIDSVQFGARIRSCFSNFLWRIFCVVERISPTVPVVSEMIMRGNATIAPTPVARVSIAPAELTELTELTTHAVVLTACEAV
jgi:hypothetical protein